MIYSRNIGFFNDRMSKYASDRNLSNVYFNHSINVLAEAEKAFNDFGDELKTNKDLMIVVLAIKSLQTFNSILLLNLHGLEADTKALLRVMTETVIQIGGICNDEDYYSEFLKKSDAQTLFIANNIVKPVHKDYLRNDTVDEVNKMDFSVLESIVKSIDKESKSLYNVAKKAKMLDIYIYVYGELSRYVHSNANIRDEYLIYEDEKLTGINNYPRNLDDQYVLLTANMVIIKALDFYNVHFGYGFDEVIVSLWESNNALYSKGE